MQFSRREFFGRIGSKDTLRTLAGFASQQLEHLLGAEKGVAGSVDEAGRALRNGRRERSSKLARKIRSPLGEEADLSPCDRTDTPSSTPPDSDQAERPHESRRSSGVLLDDSKPKAT